MDEFEKARKRQEKSNARYKARVKPKAPAPDFSVTITIKADGQEHTFDFNTPQMGGNWLRSKRTKDNFFRVASEFVKKEFGKWQSRQQT
jgi:hypothetical protein